MMDFVDKWNFSILNADDRCDGLYTRVHRNERTVIDYYLVNEQMYERFEQMEIDEKKEKYDMSDHCYMSACFRMKRSKECEEEAEVSIREYYRVKDQRSMERFVSRMEEELGMREEMNVLEMEELMGEVADECLKGKLKLKVSKSDGRVLEQPWMTEEIRNGIKHRRRLNRRKRRLMGEEYERGMEVYLRQKKLVGEMVREEKMKYEKELAKEVRESKDKCKMWELIGKLRGVDGNKSRKRAKLYDDDGKEIDIEREGEVMMSFWKTVYQRDVNEVWEAWSEDMIQEYKEQRMIGIETQRNRDEQLNVAGNILRLGRVGGVERWMEDVRFNGGDVKRRIEKIKNGKQPGPDGMKGEIYKALGKNIVCADRIAEVYNRVLDEGMVVDSWKESKTCMIGKVSRPVVKQHRPIALTNSGYKLFMGMVKEKLVEQKMSDWRVGDLQCGFTEGRRKEENLFVLKECVNECYRLKKELVVVAIDFCKAFDSVARRMLIEALKYYKCDPKVIDVVAKIYWQDRTRIVREGEEIGEIEVTSGIRQGCTGSPQLFLMVVSMIIERILRSGEGYRCGGVKIPVLFYADDGLVLARSRGEAVSMMELLEREAERCGLKLNRDKSACMIFNGEIDGGDEDSVGGVKVVSELRYLGVTVVNKRDCFGVNRKEKMRLAERMVNMTYSVIARACDRVLIGKTYWKSIVLPTVLSSGDVMVWKKDERERMQRIENGVWRRVFGVPTYTPVAALQGEIGCSGVEARDMKGKLKLLKYLMGCESGVTRKVFEGVRLGGRVNPWMRVVNRYLDELGMTCDRVKMMTNGEIVKAVNDWEHVRWRGEVQSKSTLVHYRMKDRIGGVGYDNSWGARLMFRARSNVLRLNWRGRFVGGLTECGMCGGENESLEHFLCECRCLRSIRAEFGVVTVGDAVGFGGLLFGHACRYLERIWGVRASWGN